MAGNLIDFLNSMMIAMEADDITTMAAQTTRSALGGRPMITQEEGNEDDITNTDDIFNQNEAGEGGGDPNGRADPNEAPTPEEPQEDNPENTEDIFGNQDQEEAPADDNLQDQNQTQTRDEPEDSLLFAKKNTIRDNMAYLYSIVTGDIDNLTSSLSAINDTPSLTVMNSVLMHLRNAKTYIIKTLTEDIDGLEYDELLRRYVTMKRLYDIAIHMLEIHFGDKQKDLRKKKR